MAVICRRWIALFVCLFPAWSLHADSLPMPRQVSPHAWAWIGPYEGPSRENLGFRMNLGLVIGERSVAVIDSGYSPAMAEEMSRQIRRFTPLPVAYVINTNSQPHRFFGNEVFRRQGARLIAATEAAARMSAEGHQFARSAERVLGITEGSMAVPGRPDRLIETGADTELDLGGGVRLQITHFGRTHTKGSLVVRVLPDQTLFAGDILYGGRLPAILPDGRIKDWILAFDRLRDTVASTIIPGHGQPGRLADFEQPTYAYLYALKTHMDKSVQEGLGPSQAARSFDAARWSMLANFEELAGRNAAQAFLEAEEENF